MDKLIILKNGPLAPCLFLTKIWLPPRCARYQRRRVFWVRLGMRKKTHCCDCMSRKMLGSCHRLQKHEKIVFMRSSDFCCFYHLCFHAVFISGIFVSGLSFIKSFASESCLVELVPIAPTLWTGTYLHGAGKLINFEPGLTQLPMPEMLHHFGSIPNCA